MLGVLASACPFLSAAGVSHCRVPEVACDAVQAPLTFCTAEISSASYLSPTPRSGTSAKPAHAASLSHSPCRRLLPPLACSALPLHAITLHGRHVRRMRPACRYTGALALGLCLATFGAACVSNPGEVTAASLAAHTALYPYDGLTSHARQQCWTCLWQRPARSKHCSVCNRLDTPAPPLLRIAHRASSYTTPSACTSLRKLHSQALLSSLMRCMCACLARM